MEHVFLLLVYLGAGDGRNLISNDMYFQSITDCNFFASELAKRYGNYRYYSYIDPKDRVTAYCIPKHIDPNSVKVY